jgi:hypothetical protein
MCVWCCVSSSLKTCASKVPFDTKTQLRKSTGKDEEMESEQWERRKMEMGRGVIFLFVCFSFSFLFLVWH